jgi:3-hydroxyisobutyrate dehydrogenase
MASEGFSPNVIIVDHTTTTARGAKERSLYWQEKNIHYIHAPVFMGPQSALEATGMMMVSGDQNIIQTITPELESMTGTLKNLGS